jgi:hypothetical protein
MPILFWIATIACMQEIAGAGMYPLRMGEPLPSKPKPLAPSKESRQ